MNTAAENRAYVRQQLAVRYPVFAVALAARYGTPCPRCGGIRRLGAGHHAAARELEPAGR